MADPTGTLTVEVSPDKIMLDMVERLEKIATVFESAVVRVLTLRPGDVIVLEIDHALSLEGRERIYNLAATVWPNNKTAVLDGGMRLAGVTGEGLTEPRTPNPDNSLPCP